MKVYIRHEADSEHRFLGEAPLLDVEKVIPMLKACGITGEEYEFAGQFFDDGAEAGFEVIYIAPGE